MATTLPNDAMAQLFAAAPDNDLREGENYNVCPTTNVHVIHTGPSGRRLRAMRWGFVPQWYKAPNDGPLLINARAETIAEKPAFKVACRSRRCLILASGYYEWTKTPEGGRLPWYITCQDNAPMAFAGIWQPWADGNLSVNSCAIVTLAANPALRKIHRRMPLLLDPQNWAKWLGEEGKGAAVLMRPSGLSLGQNRIVFHRVSPAVNSNRATGAQLIAPLEGS